MGAPFVGAVAASLAISEILRLLQGGPISQMIDSNLQGAEHRSAVLHLKDFTLDAGIVVLDDPICSLDANALFSAYGYIKERTKNAKQLFILTHNFTFFRLIRGWFHKLPNQQKKDVNLRPARFYMLRCVVEKAGRKSEICPLDRLLEQYESDYHYTFALVHQLATGPQLELEHYFSAPNLA